MRFEDWGLRVIRFRVWGFEFTALHIQFIFTYRIENGGCTRRCLSSLRVIGSAAF